MKEWTWLSDVKYFQLSLNTSQALALCIDVHVYIFSIIIDINEKKLIYVSNKEFMWPKMWKKKYGYQM